MCLRKLVSLGQQQLGLHLIKRREKKKSKEKIVTCHCWESNQMSWKYEKSTYNIFFIKQKLNY